MLIEFFINGKGRSIVANSLANNSFKIFEKSDKEIINGIYNIIKDNYTEAYNALYTLYANNADKKYLIVLRFLKCNFSKNDNLPDITEDGNINVEHVTCPLRGGFCKMEGIICNPKINMNLSRREKQVALLYAQGNSFEEIAEILFISKHTAKNHKQMAFKKLKIHTQSELVNWAYKNKLIK